MQSLATMAMWLRWLKGTAGNTKGDCPEATCTGLGEWRDLEDWCRQDLLNRINRNIYNGECAILQQRVLIFVGWGDAIDKANMERQ